MITKERLEELIEKEATVWFIYEKDVHPFWLFQGHDYEGVDEHKLYETKAEAEWVAKMHMARTEYFEPPTWKEFLATKTESSFAHWLCGDICIVMVEENDKKGILKTHNQFEVDIYCDGDSKLKKFDYFNNYGIDTREENYIKAVEYARKLFLGEKENE